MSDTKLRNLQRIHQIQGDPESAAAVLRERLRQGALSLERVALASYLGDASARIVLPDAEGDRCKVVGCGFPLRMHPLFPVPNAWMRICSPGVPWSFDAWVKGLALNGQETMVRAAVAAARVVSQPIDTAAGPQCRICERGIEVWLGPDESPCKCRYLEAIEAAEAWLTCPCDEHQEVWRLCNVEAGYPFAELDWIPPACNVAAVSREETIRRCAKLTTEDTIRAAIRNTLIPWALNG